ncbi:DCP1B isoform 1 [Pan troglodytes]|uniref:5'-(N(7)-methylguanosine 5'-triphospho)-[mRNA] hydrolase n=1 Tax=Pan troglodytes TaxID=9598 RepID=A0A2J8KMD3_PANTR|nr:DCP1B isoform 1 [Pan troglodytes]
MAAVAAGGLVGKGRDISLAALQRHDPYINRIVDVASQVALYTFGHRANEWEKTDVEGTLFVYTRSASPKHGFTIMNRLSMENRTEPITKDLDFQLQDPFLLYRNARCESLLLQWVVLLLKFGQVFKIVQCLPLCLHLVSVAMGGVSILTNVNV